MRGYRVWGDLSGECGIQRPLTWQRSEGIWVLRGQALGLGQRIWVAGVTLEIIQCKKMSKGATIGEVDKYSRTNVFIETKSLVHLVVEIVPLYSSFGQLLREFYILRKCGFFFLWDYSHQKCKIQLRLINHIMVQKNNSFTRWESC